ncbi:hypothetical protein TPHV1_10295 [Treponema phagedenis]|uniref:Uncharacterized protein n=1 Tax=Treponema phagedenis TaxID=162 RepID=A0A0B7GSY3_TREPH|nr:hypothetical protein TPHV1_10295 [Treponema phagedenis]
MIIESANGVINQDSKQIFKPKRNIMLPNSMGSLSEIITSYFKQVKNFRVFIEQRKNT